MEQVCFLLQNHHHHHFFLLLGTNITSTTTTTTDIGLTSHLCFKTLAGGICCYGCCCCFFSSLQPASFSRLLQVSSSSPNQTYNFLIRNALYLLIFTISINFTEKNECFHFAPPFWFRDDLITILFNKYFLSHLTSLVNKFRNLLSTTPFTNANKRAPSESFDLRERTAKSPKSHHSVLKGHNGQCLTYERNRIVTDRLPFQCMSALLQLTWGWTTILVIDWCKTLE